MHCKVYAPQDGFVVYAPTGPGGASEIRPGFLARPQQTLLLFPDLRKMQVRIALDEALFDQIKVGLPAVIKVAAFPGRTYRGRVHAVAVVPHRQTGPESDRTTFDTVVTLDEDVKDLLPGMTAVAEFRLPPVNPGQQTQESPTR
jgi:hypothetical protein